MPGRSKHHLRVVVRMVEMAGTVELSGQRLCPVPDLGLYMIRGMLAGVATDDNDEVVGRTRKQ